MKQKNTVAINFNLDQEINDQFRKFIRKHRLSQRDCISIALSNLMNLNSIQIEKLISRNLYLKEFD